MNPIQGKRDEHEDHEVDVSARYMRLEEWWRTPRPSDN
jgi:hypothetical protein